MMIELISSSKDAVMGDGDGHLDLDGGALDLLLESEDDLTRLLWDDDAPLALARDEGAVDAHRHHHQPDASVSVSVSPSVSPSPSTSSDGSETAATTEKRKQKPPLKNPSRERMKAELAFLRRHVVELENELVTLREEREQSLTTSESFELSTTVPMTAMWRQVASEQLCRRREAELENDRLKRVLEDHCRVAQSLDALMRKRSSSTVVELFEETRKRTRIASDLNDFQALQSRFRIEIQDAYSVLEDVLESSGLTAAQPDASIGFTVQTKQPSARGGEPFVEVTSVTQTPLDFARCADAVWQSITRETLRFPRRVQTCTLEGDYLAVKYDRELRRSRHHHQQQHGGVEVSTFVVSRFLDDARERLVLVWRGTTQADGTSGEWQHTYTDETGWVVLTPLPDNASGGGGGATLVRSCMHLVPRPLSLQRAPPNATQLPPVVGPICDYAVSAHEEDVNAITAAVANFFLGDAVV
ncbi:hypothetical protein PINS_up012520 [Pythium insidiosum]|nr:hypothetical protein PINS_up012520 [Pythium insidiosum]